MPFSRCVRLAVGLSCLLSVESLAAQTGTVTGVVTASDSHRPLRMSGVWLLLIPDDSVPAYRAKEKSAGPVPVNFLHAETGLDGGYVMVNVPPGDYFLSASAPGYMTAVASALAAIPADAEMTGRNWLATIPTVHVEANRIARGDLSLERGSVVSGKVTFEDGSPVTAIVAINRVAAAKSPPQVEYERGVAVMMLAGSGPHVVMTDDRGDFRTAGLAPGDYEVTVTLRVGTAFSERDGLMEEHVLGRSSLIVYAPGTLRKSQATKVSLKTGEERRDVNIVVDLTGLHTVSGGVASSVDHHSLNEGTVKLTDVADHDFQRTGLVNSEGKFVVSFVPAGAYTLEVSASDLNDETKGKGAPPPRPSKKYQRFSQPLVVSESDVTGMNLELKEAKAEVE